MYVGTSSFHLMPRRAQTRRQGTRAHPRRGRARIPAPRRLAHLAGADRARRQRHARRGVLALPQQGRPLPARCSTASRCRWRRRSLRAASARSTTRGADPNSYVAALHTVKPTPQARRVFEVALLGVEHGPLRRAACTSATWPGCATASPTSSAACGRARLGLGARRCRRRAAAQGVGAGRRADQQLDDHPQAFDLVRVGERALDAYLRGLRLKPRQRHGAHCAHAVARHPPVRRPSWMAPARAQGTATPPQLPPNSGRGRTASAGARAAERHRPRQPDEG